MMLRRLFPAVVALSIALTAAGQSVPIIEPRSADWKASAQCATHHSFRSTSLGRSMGYCLLLPADYQVNSARRYPVLYLLHGLWGSENDWMALTKITDHVRAIPLIVVMPQADDGWYTNSAVQPAARYEDYIFGDLIAEIDANYRTLPSRGARFIAGLSMGGYGAMKAALKYPKMFSSIGAFSSAFGAARRVSMSISTPALVFGPPGSATRRQNDEFALLAKADPASLPYLFVMTGAEDSLVLDDNRDFLSLARLLNLRYEYHEVPGRHEWPFWDHCLKDFLAVITPRISK